MSAARGCMLRTARVRSNMLVWTVDRYPWLGNLAVAFPVKLMNACACAGSVCVVFATVPHMTYRTFGAVSCCIAVSVLTIGYRAHTDEDIVNTFGPIMLGTLRHKIKVLHGILQTLGTALIGVGSWLVVVARVHDRRGNPSVSLVWPADTSSAEAFLHAPQRLACVVATALLAIQVAAVLCPCCFGGGGGAGDPRGFHAALGPFTHDAICVAQILTVLALGVSSLSTTLVAGSLMAVWIANAIQINQLDADDQVVTKSINSSGDSQKISFSV